MTEFGYQLRDGILGGGYRHIVKPVYFQFDPELVHNRITTLGQALGKSIITQGLTSAAFGYDHPMLHTKIAGIKLRNPIGLSAGFDKEGKLVDIMPSVGFGFMEIGSVTGTPCPGNPKPRLWRLKKSRGLNVFMGLNSSGAESVATRLRSKEMRLPWFVSIAKANIPEMDSLEAGIADYVKGAKAFDGIGAARVINISCPNTTGGEPFQNPENLDRLLTVLDPWLRNYPVFIKMPADESLEQITELVTAARRHHVTGFMCTNLTRDRSNPAIRDNAVPPRGGLSGKIVEAKSNAVLAHVYKITNGKMPLIGVGGVFTAADAYKKIRLGASSMQLITGMIYNGPSVISEIKRGLVDLLQRDGFSSISEAIGADV